MGTEDEVLCIQRFSGFPDDKLWECSSELWAEVHIFWDKRKSHTQNDGQEFMEFRRLGLRKIFWFISIMLRGEKIYKHFQAFFFFWERRVETDNEMSFLMLEDILLAYSQEWHSLVHFSAGRNLWIHLKNRFFFKKTTIVPMQIALKYWYGFVIISLPM